MDYDGKGQKQLRLILRKIHGPVLDNNGIRRIRMNNEIDQIIDEADIVKYIKAKRRAGLGHLERMQENRVVKIIVQWTLQGKRAKGIPRRGWKDDMKDVKTLGLKNWKRMASNTSEWHNVVRLAKVHRGL